MKKIALVSILSIIVDQIIKLIIVNNISLNTSVTVINNFFKITYVRNYGAAFSILNGNRMFLIIVTILALFLIYIFFIKNQKQSNLDQILYGLLLGGIIGNLIDRTIYSYVIDYLDFSLLGLNMPIFNFADMCIVISTIIIVFITIRGSIYGNNRK